MFEVESLPLFETHYTTKGQSCPRFLHTYQKGTTPLRIGSSKDISSVLVFLWRASLFKVKTCSHPPADWVQFLFESAYPIRSAGRSFFNLQEGRAWDHLWLRSCAIRRRRSKSAVPPTPTGATAASAASSHWLGDWALAPARVTALGPEPDDSLMV